MTGGSADSTVHRRADVIDELASHGAGSSRRLPRRVGVALRGVQLSIGRVLVAVQDAAATSSEVNATVRTLVSCDDSGSTELVRVVVEARPDRSAVLGEVHPPNIVDHPKHVNRGRVRCAVLGLAESD